MRWTVAILCLLLFALPCVPAADPPAKDEEMKELDRHIDDALAFLQKQQLQDGGWMAGNGIRGAGGQAHPAVTSLCVMAFLSAGHVPGEGRYGAAVEKGIRYVLQCQLPNGLIARGAAGNQEMYTHGISTLMLAEAAGMTDGDLGDEIRKKLHDAVNVILTAQRKKEGPGKGGWRYTVADFDPSSDISVTGWQIMALRAAKNVGCDVPAERIDAAVAFIKRCHDANSGGFDYQPGSNLTVPVTGTSILALELCGKDQHRSDLVIRAGDFLLKQVVERYNNGPFNNGISLFGNFHYYGVYYVSQAMFQLGGNYWDAYRPVLHGILYRDQLPRDASADYGGSWGSGLRPIRGGDGGYGANYCTAMCVLALTVEYRYLPIYQRDEEPTDK
ncbi:MAG TPA: prenyltransferase/squalene oxidase repeat-containing protein [Gemmataceae bacterium]|nr:prenyltransferase/squalene oxidase repeat-containing protein [Gemmataceae bacterium]